MHRAPATLLLLAALLAAAAPPPAAGAAGHVVIAVVDGPRHTEFLDEPGRPHAPVLDGSLIPAGSHLAVFRNEEETRTLPGHAAILTGTAQPIANDGSEPPHAPTLFERLRKDTGLGPGAAWIVAGKDKLAAVAASDHPDYGAAYAASVDAVLRSDAATFAAAASVLTAPSPPVVTCINFAGVDLAGHSGVWADYLQALSAADSLLGELWSLIESTPALAGDTNIFITSDHGRHDDAHGGFTGHGDGCAGCRTLPFVALGPDIREGLVSQTPGRQEDVAATVAWLLGLEGPPMEGFVLSGILVDPSQTGVGDRPPGPPAVLAAPNPFAHRVEFAVAGDWRPEVMEVFGADGRLVFAKRTGPGGRYAWEGTSLTAAPSPPGVYWIRFRDAAGSSRHVRIVRLP